MMLPGLMLKITVEKGPEETRFSLEGKLIGPWVAELRRCWESGECICKGGGRIVLDLSEVDFVDPDGQLLLADMHRKGVKLVASTPLIRELVTEICRCGCDTVEKGASRSPNASPERSRNGPRQK